MYSELHSLLKYYKQNLYELNECLIPIIVIAEKSAEINKTSHRLILGRIQGILFNHLVLNISKLFDPPVSKYPVVSVPSILKYLNDNEGVLINSKLKDRFDEFFRDKNSSNIVDDSAINSICTYYQQLIKDKQHILKGIKSRRDKAIAHNEAIELDKLNTINWNDILELKRLAEEFMECMDYCFFNQSTGHYTDLGRVKMSMDGLYRSITKCQRVINMSFADKGVYRI